MNCIRCDKPVSNNKCYFCLKFGEIKTPETKQDIKNHHYFLSYKLSDQQLKISNKIKKHKGNVLLEAVCGSGKTEIVLETISYFLRKNKKIGFVIPRRTLVSEIGKRLKSIFKYNSVETVYGKDKFKEADIVVLTAHKTHLYTSYFDLVIIDEADAYPLSDDPVLQKLTLNLAKEKTIAISATPPEYILSLGWKWFELNNRHHKQPMPIPKSIVTPFIKNKLKSILKQNLKLIVYFPTIKMQLEYYEHFKDLFPIFIINSKTKNTKSRLMSFSFGRDWIIFSTSTLERGITIKNLSVAVVAADHELFNSDVLIQISGRVGRVKGYEDGKIYFLSNSKTAAIIESIRTIKDKNLHTL